MDVTSACLASQRGIDAHELLWIVGDELHDRRYHVYSTIERDRGLNVMPFKPKREGRHRNLCAAYNEALDRASSWRATHFVSLQDYIVIPHDGLSRFVQAIDGAIEMDELPIVSGVTHITGTMLWHVVDLDDDYSIFHRPVRAVDPFDREGAHEDPKFWTDVRITDLYADSPDDAIVQIAPVHWETNWAALPMSLYDAGLRWDVEYDQGAAYENQDVAIRAVKQFGATAWMDKGNVAYSLPHRDAFPGYHEELRAHGNREFHERRHGL